MQILHFQTKKYRTSYKKIYYYLWWHFFSLFSLLSQGASFLFNHLKHFLYINIHNCKVRRISLNLMDWLAFIERNYYKQYKTRFLVNACLSKIPVNYYRLSMIKYFVPNGYCKKTISKCLEWNNLQLIFTFEIMFLCYVIHYFKFFIFIIQLVKHCDIFIVFISNM